MTLTNKKEDKKNNQNNSLINKKAPSFSLKDKEGKQIKLNEIKSDYIVLFFYPKDNTPGCTIEAHNFSVDIKKYQKLNTEIIGISGGDEKSKAIFCKKNNLKITLLSDKDFKISNRYNVYGEKKFMGNTYLGISRTTFILNKNKKIIKIFENVKPNIHSKEILDFLRELK